MSVRVISVYCPYERLFFEGEEETGSPNMQAFVEEHQALLAADALLICDGPFDPE